MRNSAAKMPYQESVSGWLRDVVAPIAQAAQEGKGFRLKENGVDPREFFLAEFKNQRVLAQAAEHDSFYDKAV
ncbi:TPA: hypothetical protein UL939_000246 [Stenotrophomonas maltophilia]|uniref:hypothetical protein n=1 Tax=Stenotrophomonas TaxID=40323 RepID=UPI00092F54F3|nr:MULTISPECIES: hypothetical protein [Stenotrophomonas]EKT4068277.1 hypothetical protein [Stenotrophomonas maltophilia]EKV1265426.1 hypothetical protein [Stenotrophomonas maltophilia]MBA0271843.1 hypothetical protein [Stenotrophomonas maltophilia]MBH1729297.1 hypothetical protein [Stenotrophomonas maltophilia]MBN5076247.1 hypothetical protein [Stenotrophomonas maltophilia]